MRRNANAAINSKATPTPNTAPKRAKLPMMRKNATPTPHVGSQQSKATSSLTINSSVSDKGNFGRKVGSVTNSRALSNQKMHMVMVQAGIWSLKRIHDGFLKWFGNSVFFFFFSVSVCKMDAENREDHDSHSGSSGELPRNPIAPQGMGSVGEEAASNIVGGGSGTGPLGSTATPIGSTHAATNSGLTGSKSVNFRKHKEHPNFAHACIDMEGKFRKYYEEMPPIFMLATVMDPRMKLQGVSLLLREIGRNLWITTLPSSANVNDLLTTMYAKYDSKFRSNAACTDAPLTSSTSTNDEFWDFVSSNLGIGSSTVTSRIELEKYLDLESVNANDRRDFDVLAWWEKNEDKYLVLSIMARDLLTPLVSIGASELLLVQVKECCKRGGAD
ncbi:hypothetical protein RHSIM_Rhsim07G0151100 [Rhododendron simsii]|uniref:HAT C-terminal dimerisation domain-containing protein n=1 Tax=Rhododendron simsii TaxID=118357 RepID=A0A834GZI6_RHOSS|nr:hypothetical protein RHSIM_Rhsim07G0151100 [Rhododendron simsii]